MEDGVRRGGGGGEPGEGGEARIPVSPAKVFPACVFPPGHCRSIQMIPPKQSYWYLYSASAWGVASRRIILSPSLGPLARHCRLFQADQCLSSVTYSSVAYSSVAYSSVAYSSVAYSSVEQCILQQCILQQCTLQQCSLQQCRAVYPTAV